MRSAYEISEEIMDILAFKLIKPEYDEELRQTLNWLLDDWKTEIQELT